MAYVVDGHWAKSPSHTGQNPQVTMGRIPVQKTESAWNGRWAINLNVPDCIPHIAIRTDGVFTICPTVESHAETSCNFCSNTFLEKLLVLTYMKKIGTNVQCVSSQGLEAVFCVKQKCNLSEVSSIYTMHKVKNQLIDFYNVIVQGLKSKSK